MYLKIFGILIKSLGDYFPFFYFFKTSFLLLCSFLFIPTCFVNSISSIAVRDEERGDSDDYGDKSDHNSDQELWGGMEGH